MPYKITPKCSGRDSLCQDACSYDCIHTVSEFGHQHLEIDEDQCTDCGACAVACRESAIAFDNDYMAFKPQPMAPATVKGAITGSAGGWDGKEDPRAKVEVPEGFVVIDRKIQSWARLMSDTSN